MIPGKVYTPRDVMAAVWRRRWWIMMPSILLGSAAFVAVMSLSYNYRSVSTVQVLPDPAATAMMRSTTDSSPADRISSINQETLTRARLERIIYDLDLYKETRRKSVMENVVTGMRNDITFRQTDRDVFQVGFTAKDPQTAFDVATRLTQLFLAENAQTRGQRAEAATQFLDTQLAEARAKLDVQEKKIEAFRLQYSGQLPSQLESNVQELNNTQLRLRTVDELLGRDRDQKLFLQRQLELAQAAGDDTPTGAARGTAAAPAGGSSVADELAAAQANLRVLERRFTEDYPDVQVARRQVATLQQRLASERPAGGGAAGAAKTQSPRVREILAQIELTDRQIAGRQQEETQLRSRIASYTQRVDVAPLRESELATLTRDYEDTKRLYSSTLQRQQEAKMSASLDRNALGDRFRVIEPARVPEKPFSPSRRNYLLIGLAIAAVLSIGLAGAVEYRDNCLRTDEEVIASLRLPVLATIPLLDGAMTRRTR